MEDLTSSEFNRLIQYLREKKWSDEEILKLLEDVFR